MADKTAYYYRRLPYTRRVEPATYRAWIEELPSIETVADSQEKALARLSVIFDGRIETMIEAGDHIPEPDLWPNGLFDPGSDENLRRLIRETSVRRRQPSQEEVRLPPELGHAVVGSPEANSLEQRLVETWRGAYPTHEELAGKFDHWLPASVVTNRM